LLFSPILSLSSLFSSRFFTHASKSVNQVSEDDEYSSHSSSRYVLRHSKLHLRPVRTLIDWWGDSIFLVRNYAVFALFPVEMRSSFTTVWYRKGVFCRVSLSPLFGRRVFVRVAFKVRWWKTRWTRHFFFSFSNSWWCWV